MGKPHLRGRQIADVAWNADNGALERTPAVIEFARHLCRVPPAFARKDPGTHRSSGRGEGGRREEKD